MHPSGGDGVFVNRYKGIKFGEVLGRWEEYLPLGKRIEGTRFITFKVPLEQGITANIPEEDQFTPTTLVKLVMEQGQQLGLVIDLTNTKRYYRSQDLMRLNVKYHKIFTEGHVVPSRKVMAQFFSIVDRFVNDKSNADKLVGVHCTHGVNRTGYLVCRYMIDNLEFEPEQALKAYSTGRGYPVERENYISDLKKGKSAEPLSSCDFSEEVEQRDDYSQGRDHSRQSGRRWGASNGSSYQDRRHATRDTCQHRQQEFDEPPSAHHPQYDYGYGNGRYNYGHYPPASYGNRRGAGWGSSLADSGHHSYGHDHSSRGSSGEQMGGYSSMRGQRGGYGNRGSQWNAYSNRGSWNSARYMPEDEYSRAGWSRSSRH